MHHPANPIFRPLEETLSTAWSTIPSAYRRALAIILAVNVVAFGFEMANLSFHHDDVVQFFSNDARLGHQLGRFGYSWLHSYTQGNYYLPFFQLLEGLICTTAFALVIAYAWGTRRTVEVVLLGSIICVYPYMAQLYQYDTSAFPFAFAHLLVGLAALLSLRLSILRIALAVILYAAAFSIYQSVLGNALAVLAFVMVSRALSPDGEHMLYSRNTLTAASGAVLAIIGGGLLYLLIVTVSGIQIDSYQDADKAFTLSDGIDIPHAFSVVVHGTRNSLVWPENYFPLWLKQVQLAILVVAGLFCLLCPRGAINKAGAIIFLCLGVFAPRVLQFLHPAGDFHNLTLTGYAVVIAGSFMIVFRCANSVVRNASLIIAAVLIFGYAIQDNWISTVNRLNWTAHQITMSQILTKIRSLPSDDWDGLTVAVIGKHEMVNVYPYKRQTGVATTFIDEEHFEIFSRLLRQNLHVVRSHDLPSNILAVAAKTSAWPAAESVRTFGGIALVVLSPATGK